VAEARVNGVRLYYEEHGEGEPILCIHGTSSSATIWRPAAEATPNARLTFVGGGHLIDPAGPEVLAFLREVLGA
jgi:pimeloyl-ACP methyl ester carboxylesterase